MYVAVCCSVLQSLAVPVTCQHVNTLVPAISLSSTRQIISMDIPIALSTAHFQYHYADDYLPTLCTHYLDTIRQHSLHHNDDSNI